MVNTNAVKLRGDLLLTSWRQGTVVSLVVVCSLLLLSLSSSLLLPLLWCKAA